MSPLGLGGAATGRGLTLRIFLHFLQLEIMEASPGATGVTRKIISGLRAKHHGQWHGGGSGGDAGTLTDMSSSSPCVMSICLKFVQIVGNRPCHSLGLSSSCDRILGLFTC